MSWSRWRAAALTRLLLAALVLGNARPSGAQADLKVSILDIDDRAFPQVTATIAADQQGRPISEMAPVDVDIEESGNGAGLLSIRRAVDANMPLALVFAIDVSGSMAGEPLAKAKSSAISFVTGMGAADVAAVVVFGDAVRVEQSLTRDRAALVEAVSRLTADGGTPLYDAVAESARIAAGSGFVRRAVVLLSDGKESGEASRLGRQESLAVASNAGTLFYVVGVGTDFDRAYLEELAQRSQGRFFEAFGSADIPGVYSLLEELLRGQLVLMFRATSSPDLLDRSLKISFRQGALSATTEREYRSLRQPGTSAGSFSVGAPIAGAILLTLLVGLGLAWRQRRAGRFVGEWAETASLAPVVGVAHSFPRSAKLAVASGAEPNGLQPISISERPVTVGYGEGCGIRLVPSAGVAAQHARLWLRHGRIMLHHLAPGETTSVGGRSVSWASLGEGDEAVIGPYVLRYLAEALGGDVSTEGAKAR